jgi:hypothetical protein
MWRPQRGLPRPVRRAAGGWRAQLIEEEGSLGRMFRPATIPFGHQVSLSSAPLPHGFTTVASRWG